MIIKFEFTMLESIKRAGWKVRIVEDDSIAIFPLTSTEPKEWLMKRLNRRG